MFESIPFLERIYGLLQFCNTRTLAVTREHCPISSTLPFLELEVAVPDPAFRPGGKVIAVLAQRLLKLTWLWLWILTIRPLAVPRIFIKNFKNPIKISRDVCLLTKCGKISEHLKNLSSDINLTFDVDFRISSWLLMTTPQLQKMPGKIPKLLGPSCARTFRR